MKRSVVIEELHESDIRPLELFDQYLEIARGEALEEFGDRSALVEIDCPACGEEERSLGFEKHGFDYQVCARCETLYASPRPDAERLEQFRARSRALRFWSERFLSATAEARSENIHARRADWLAGAVDEYLPDAASCVDAGAGSGLFLEQVAGLERFRSLTALEANPELAEACRARGVAVVEGPIEQLTQEGLRADVLTGFELLQQVHSPRRFVESAREVLRPGGLLLLTTLTISGFDLRVLWERSRNIYPPFHINFLSIEGIERLLADAGFEALEVSTPGQLDVDIVQRELAEGEELDRFLSYVLRRRGSREHRSLQEFLQRNRLSSHVRVAARRREDGGYHRAP